MDKSEFLTKLGERVRRLREERGWSQEDLGARCGKDRQSIERLENGKVNPSVYYLKEVADALELPLNKVVEQYK